MMQPFRNLSVIHHDDEKTTSHEDVDDISVPTDTTIALDVIGVVVPYCSSTAACNAQLKHPVNMYYF
jgi:hypothetical protein